ncbi:hypothetical protein DWB77_04817 [Streptomyces hundungensis]|uniref:Uncharacterized protein n=1 Tax=Streptomyces hundungensis TaxID=1077946 RepID=A0A387HGT2_9ACTN|nr:hypothetical protein DWB77_04817 [Streptomyces hundungensis]
MSPSDAWPHCLSLLCAATHPTAVGRPPYIRTRDGSHSTTWEVSSPQIPDYCPELRVTTQEARATVPATPNTEGQAPTFLASGWDPANAAT